jgi:hypothetical protein
MIECPRCGFTQPDDRYCANCGLDSLVYKPKPRLWYQMLLRSSLFQIALSIGIVLLLIFALFRPKSENQILPTSTVTSRQPVHNEPDIATRPAKAAIPPAPIHAPEIDDDLEEIETVDDKQPAPKTVVASPDKVDIEFFEIPRDQLASALTESEGLSQTAAVQIFKIHSKEVYQNLLKGARRLPGAASLSLAFEKHQGLSFSVPLQTTMGLVLDVVQPSATGDQDPHRKPASVSVTGELIGLQKDAQDQVLHVQIDELLSMSDDSPVLIVGLIPNNLSFGPQPPDLSGTPLKVISSQNFQQNLTSAVITLQYKEPYP